MNIGMIGAGRLGQALAHRLVSAGHQVMISNSRGAEAVKDIATKLGCKAGSAEAAAEFGDVVVVSVPLHAFNLLPAGRIGIRIVIDTCNYYPGRDGCVAGLEQGHETTSGLLQRALPQARVVKAFNSVLSTNLSKGGLVIKSGGRHALPIASDDEEAARLVSTLVVDTGFDPVMTGPITKSWRFERARPGYCRVLDAAALAKIIGQTIRADFVPEGSWRH